MMNKRIIYAVVLGVILYSLIAYLNVIQGDLTIHQLILIIVTPLLIGITVGTVKKSALFGFVISFVMLTLEVFIVQAGASANINVLAAVLLASVLPLALISTGLAALGGLVGKKVIKK
jgi:hypothetical protein